VNERVYDALAIHPSEKTWDEETKKGGIFFSTPFIKI